MQIPITMLPTMGSKSNKVRHQTTTKRILGIKVVDVVAAIAINRALASTITIWEATAIT